MDSVHTGLFPAEAGPTEIKSVCAPPLTSKAMRTATEAARAAFSGTGFSREGVSGSTGGFSRFFLANRNNGIFCQGRFVSVSGRHDLLFAALMTAPGS
jgi:hypothetical protein